MCENCEGTGYVECWCPLVSAVRTPICSQCGPCDECGGTGQ